MMMMIMNNMYQNMKVKFQEEKEMEKEKNIVMEK